jgi:hypothetical protein
MRTQERAASLEDRQPVRARADAWLEVASGGRTLTLGHEKPFYI